MKRLPMANDHVRPDVCGPCGGKCCKNTAGSALPSDFGSCPEEVQAELELALSSGWWVVDHWVGDPRPVQDREVFDEDDYDFFLGWFVRPRHVGESSVFQESWGGACSWLGPDGCTVFNKRPSGCRGLNPSRGDECTVEYAGKREAAIAWIPYHEQLQAAAKVANELAE